MTLYFVAALKVEIAGLGVEPQINPLPVVSIQKKNPRSQNDTAKCRIPYACNMRPTQLD